MGFVLAFLHLLLDVAAALPRVEDPWPSSVGLGLPFTFAGGGGVLANVFSAGRSPDEQARATSLWALRLFWLGVLSYFLLFLNQILSFA